MPYPDGPAAISATLTPNDATVLPGGGYRGFYVGVSGDVTIKDGAGNLALYKNVPAGTVIPAVFTVLMNTGTTATNIIGMR